jgi:uncharacterized membrane protein
VLLLKRPYLDEFLVQIQNITFSLVSLFLLLFLSIWWSVINVIHFVCCVLLQEAVYEFYDIMIWSANSMYLLNETKRKSQRKKK